MVLNLSGMWVRLHVSDVSVVSPGVTFGTELAHLSCQLGRHALVFLKQIPRIVVETGSERRSVSLPLFLRMNEKRSVRATGSALEEKILSSEALPFLAF